MDLGFRRLEAEDKERLLDWRNRPEVAAYMYTDRRITPEEHEAWFAGIETDARRDYWLILLDGEPAGLLNLYDIQPEHGRASWAYYLAEIGSRGRGLGAKIEYRLLTHVFEERGLNKLWCEVLESNEGVIRLHRSFGFKEEAVLRAHVRKGGEYIDVIGLGLLARDWPAAKAQAAARLEKLGIAAPAASGL